MKSARFVLLTLTTLGAALALAGCQSNKMTLEQAQAQCAKTGGFLAVIYTQEVSAAGIGPEVASPGDCISAGKFGVAPAAPAAPSNAPSH